MTAAPLTLAPPSAIIGGVAYQYFRSEGQLGRIDEDTRETQVLLADGTWSPFYIGQSDMTLVSEATAQTMAAGASLAAPAA